MSAPAAFTPQEKRLSLIAIILVFILSALDQTIVSTAMPKIIEHLKGIELYAWVTTAYMLTSTVMMPIFGKLGDLFGRKVVFIIGVGLFLLGSALCGLSGEFGTLPVLGSGMVQLVVFRGFQGIGGAALFSTAFSLVADLFSPRERGKYLGLFGGVYGVASAVGPLIGGFFTDHGTITLYGIEIAGWRWVFYVNLPVGFFSLYIIARYMPQLAHKLTGKIDFLGAALFICSAVPALLALTWAGSTYAWDSAVIVALFAGSAVALVLFVYVESKVTSPILPLGLFVNKVFTIANAAGFFIGMSFIGVVMFLPLFTQLVQGISATKSGITMLPIMVGMIGASTLSGQLVSRTGHYKVYIVGGTVLMVADLLLMWDIGPTTTPTALALRMFVVGIGMGPSQSLFNLVVQNAVPVTQIGIATAASNFFRQMGQVVGLAVFGTLLTLNLQAEMPKSMPAGFVMAAGKIDLSEAQSQAMDPGRIRRIADSQIEVRYQAIEKAFTGDSVAEGMVQNDPLVPGDIKGALSARIMGGSRDAGEALESAHAEMLAQADTLSAQILTGIRRAFSAAITGMFSTSLWLGVLALMIVVFLPALPLRNTNATQDRAALERSAKEKAEAAADALH